MNRDDAIPGQQPRRQVVAEIRVPHPPVRADHHPGPQSGRLCCSNCDLPDAPHSATDRMSVIHGHPFGSRLKYRNRRHAESVELPELDQAGEISAPGTHPLEGSLRLDLALLEEHEGVSVPHRR
jgi:hypothetical protein